MNEIQASHIIVESVSQPELIPEGVKFINAPNFWSKSSMGEGRVVAVLDSGCDITHPDLADRILDIQNFTQDDNSNPQIVTDYSGHGTHVSGIIAANSNNSGIIGVAPKAKLLILKVLGSNGGSYDNLIKAMDYAINKKVDVINMSLGSSLPYPPLEQMIKKAIAHNISVVCAAGNEGDGRSDTIEISYPASYVDSISVGSATINDKFSYFTNSNLTVDLLAPGEEIQGKGILSTAPGGKYILMRGTSMAAPHVSGAIALIKNWAKSTFRRELSEIEIYAQLIKMTRSINLPKTIEGSGMLYLMER